MDRRALWSSRAVSVVLHGVLIVGLLLVRPATVPETRTQNVTQLVFAPPSHYVAEPAIHHPITVHVPQPLPVIARKPSPFVAPVPVRQHTKAEVAMPTPEPALTAASVPVPIRLTAPDLPAAVPVVKTGVFGEAGTSSKGLVVNQRLEVQTGSFGGADGRPRNEARPAGGGVHVALATRAQVHRLARASEL